MRRAAGAAPAGARTAVTSPVGGASELRGGRAGGRAAVAAVQEVGRWGKLTRMTRGSPSRSRRVVGFLGTLALLLGAGGGCAYEGRWAEAGMTPTPTTGIAGRWAGTWRSDANGHAGGLRCIVTPIDGQTFKADFKATYGWLFTFTYQAVMRVKATDGATRPGHVYFAGEQDLGWLAGGTYAYDGKAGTTEFFCAYRSKGDHGTFQLVRPGGTPAAAER